MSCAANPSVTCLSPRFHSFIVGLIAVLGLHAAQHRESGPVLYLLYRRLLRWRRRFEALVACVAAGTLRDPPSRPLSRRAAPPTGPAPVASPPPLHLPREFGWVVRLVGWRAAPYGGYLRQILSLPEMQDLLRVAPQAADIFRPLCRMLHVDPAEVLPPRPRRRRQPPMPDTSRPTGGGAVHNVDAETIPASAAAAATLDAASPVRAGVARQGPPSSSDPPPTAPGADLVGLPLTNRSRLPA